MDTGYAHQLDPNSVTTTDSALILGPFVPMDIHPRSEFTAGEILGDDVQDPGLRAHVVQAILSGDTQLISFPGTSQYAAGGGASACGLASLNCARCLLSAAARSVDLQSFLSLIISRQAVEEITSICSLWSDDLHLEVEDIYRTPFFEHSLNLINTRFSGEMRAESFKNFLLKELMTIETSAAAIITRPPEILTCIKFLIAGTTVFLIFDSHTRPSHKAGAGLTLTTSLDATATALAQIVAVDPTLLADRDVQWETQLLTQFSGHVFVHRPPVGDGGLTDPLLESSLIMMSLKARIASLESQTSILKSENTRLTTENQKLSTDNQKLKNALIRPPKHPHSHASSDGASTSSSRRDGDKTRDARPLPNPSPSSVKDDVTRRPQPKRPGDAFRPPGPSQGKPTPTPNPPTTTHAPTSSSSPRSGDYPISYASAVAGPSSHRRRGSADSNYLPPYTEEESRAGPSHSVRFVGERSTAPHGPYGSHRTYEVWMPSGRSTSPITTASSGSGSSHAARHHPPSDRGTQHDADYALQMQRDLDEETARIGSEFQHLAPLIHTKFKCHICFEVLPEDYVARAAPCSHEFCRECLKNHVSTTLQAHRFPVFCPVCVAGHSRHEPSSISNLLAQEVGINEMENALWTEMELAGLSVLIHCKGCGRGAFVDRLQYEEYPEIMCPLPSCRYRWCRNCQQRLGSLFSHSCDGTLEFDKLMKKEGWRNCPGCSAPIQKATGCNHVACAAPGCNTHFCYSCGKQIIQSALRSEISDAVDAHYKKCKLF